MNYKIILPVFSFVLLQCIVLGASSSLGCMDMNKNSAPVCLNPPPINTQKTSNDSKWNHEHANKERHIHFGSKSARQFIAGFFKGNELDDSFNDYMQFCPSAEVAYSPGHVDTVFTGFDKKTFDVKCIVSEETKGALWCDVKSTSTDYSDTMKLYPHYIEGVLVATMCFGNGGVGWLAWSTHDYLNIEEALMVLDYIKSIGFDPSDLVTFYNDMCPKKCITE